MGGASQAASSLGLAGWVVPGDWWGQRAESLGLGDPFPLQVAPLCALHQCSLSLPGHGVCLRGWGPH